MVTFRIRDQEATDPERYLAWDTVWNQQEMAFDWVVVGGALQSSRAIDTAIVIQLATWRRADVSDNLPSGEDPQGWWGDTVDVEDDEGPLGSKLWLLYRSKLDDDTGRQAIAYAQQALQPLLKQGVFVRFDITADIDKIKGFLALNIAGYSQDGTKKYDQRFARLWQQEFSSTTR